MRASFSTAFQLPSPYYYANTYILRDGDPNQLATASNLFNQQNITGNPDVLIVGNTNDKEAFSRTTGVQMYFRVRDVLRKYDFKTDIGLTVAIGRERLPFNQGILNRVRMQPELMGQFNFSFKPFQKIYLHFNNTIMGDWVKRYVFSATEPAFNKGFYTLDVIGRVELNRHFQISLQVNNILNQKYGGLEATGFIDDLNYNPQPGVRLFLGLSYSLN